MLFLIVSSFLWGRCARAQDFSALKNTGQGQVIEVITPYSVQLDNGQIIRLSGIHLPDYSADEAGDFSLLALNVLKDMLDGQRVMVFQSSDRDKGRINRMGHALAHLQREKDGMWIQGALLSLGLAQVKTSQRNPEMAGIMYELERSARNENLGIWAGTSTVLSPEGAQAHIGRFQVVEGKIESVAMNKNRLYLNFGGNWRDDFTVSIPPADLKRFSQSGLDPLQWGGQRIRVRGMLESYNGPHIEINHPEAIERLDVPQTLQDERKGSMLETIRP